MSTKRFTFRSSAFDPRNWSTQGVIALCAVVAPLACHNNDDGDDGVGVASDVEMVRHWNSVSIDTSGIDHMPSNQGPTHTFGQQVGPCRAARAMAIVHIALFEVMNAMEGQPYQSYIGLAQPPAGTSMGAAVAQTMHDTLLALYPSQSARLDNYLANDLAQISNGAAKTQGITLGQTAAQMIMTLRTNDGSQLPEVTYANYLIANGPPAPGEWSQDPITLHPLALGADWNQVNPFVMTSADQFLAPPPPAMTSAAYQFAYEEEKVLGGDGVTTPTARSEEQTETGIFWAYDGTPSLCAPPRLYNQVIIQIAKDRNTPALELARLLAVANVAMADVGIAIWDSKYTYKFWRPITGIRGASTDGNANTAEDTTFSPLGAPASNLIGPNFTPPFPSYPSGHAGFGGALFQVLRRFYSTDDIGFTFTSDEFNGVTLDNQGVVRPLAPRTYDNLSEPEEENGQSRIYLGIHWRFDKSEGIAQGNDVGNYVFDHIYPHQ